jgi:membrane-bound lytic murein transglycosylase B
MGVTSGLLNVIWLFVVRRGALVATLLVALSSAAAAADCGESGAGFEAWLQRFKAKAAAQGISPAVIASAFAGVSYDPTVVRLDRSQRSFKLSFEEFYARRVGPGLMRRGQSLMRTHQATLARIEQRFGVPPQILIAIWGLETNYGADSPAANTRSCARWRRLPTIADARSSSLGISWMPCAFCSAAT